VNSPQNQRRLIGWSENPVADPKARITSAEFQGMSTIDRLKAIITGEVSRYVDPNDKFALLDFPNHPNVGDSAIWLGELAYFKSVYGAGPAFVSTMQNCDATALRRAVPSGTIFLSGGGNLGDLWPEQQAFRELVLEQFSDRQIVQLPQSIHFGSTDNQRRAASAINAHKKFVLFVRDHRSFELATAAYNCPIHLVPDMAFWMGARLRTVAAQHRLLLLLRTDKESSRILSSKPVQIPAGGIALDWLDEDPALYLKQKRASAAISPFVLKMGALDKAKQREFLFRNLAENRVRRGVEILSSASFVITDRLHCHILCVLLGIPHIVFDNSYQKLGHFIDAWTKECGLVQIAGSLEEALELWTTLQSDCGAHKA
jgi:exopolysaccharide biosynthesis predicted pyruvyltransferase EpsI